MPTTSLNASSSPPARCGSTSLTLESTSELRTIGVTPSIREPETATPSAQATIRTAQALSAAPPIASSARTGCQVIRSRILAPPHCSRPCPSEAARITMNSAPSDTSSDGSASPSAIGASQTPKRPPSSSPAVAKAPVTKPCQ